MDRKFLNTISPIVREKPLWDAFIAIIEFYEDENLKKMIGNPEIDELIRISAIHNFLNKVKRLRDTAIHADEHTRSE